MRNQNTIIRLKYINSIQFSFQTIPKLTCKVVLSLSKGKYLVNPRNLHKCGRGLNIEGGLFQISTKREGAYQRREGFNREKGLIREGA